MHMSVQRRGLGDLSLDRSKQINTLLIFNENVSEIQPNVQYRVDFVSGGQPLSLVVLLPPEFPKDRPTMFVEPRNVQHPWIREDGAVVGAPGLVSFGIHSDLGRVVQAIKRELEKNPPIFKTPSQQQHPIVNGQTSFPQHQSFPHQQQRPTNHPLFQQQQGALQATSNSTPSPNLSSIPELSKLTADDLHELNENPIALKSFVRTLCKPDNQLKCEEVQVLSLADQKLSEIRGQIDACVANRRQLSDQVEQKRASLLASLDRFNSTRDALLQTTNSIKEHRLRYSTKNLCEMMLQSSLVDEEKSEKFADEFLAGNLNVEQFVTDYIKIRSDHHKKKVAVEKVKRDRK